MAKYDPLRDHLIQQDNDEVQLTFDDIEKLVGPLPESARTHRAWWSNDSKVEALSWHAAGFRVRSVDLTNERVLFSRVGASGRNQDLRVNSLARVLANTVYINEDIEIIASRSGVDPGKVEWTGTPIEMWASVLTVARKTDSVDNVLDNLLQQAPKLHGAIDAYRKDTEGSFLNQPAQYEMPTVTTVITAASNVAALAVGELNGRPVVVAGCEDAAIRIWDLITEEQIGPPIYGHTGSVWAVALGELGGLPIAVTGGDDSTVRIIDMASGALLGSALTGHTAPVNSVALGSSGDRLLAVSGSDDQTLRLWDLANGQPISVFTGHDNWVNGVDFGVLADKSIVISGSTDTSIRVWDTENGQTVLRLTGHSGSVSSVGFGYLNRRPIAISGSTDETVRVWDLENGELYATFTGHVGSVRAVALGALEGRPVAISGGDDRTIRLWDLETRAAIGSPLREHLDSVRALASSVEDGGLFLASGSDDRTVRVWAVQRDHVEWLSDSAGGEDLLGRQPLAHALATRLRRFQEEEHGTSFLVHVDGRWGTGKSSLLTLLQSELEQEPKWLTISFNAWRQSRIGAPWWAMLAVLRHDLARSHLPPARVWLRIAESWARFRRSGAPFALAFIVLLIAATAVFLLLRPEELTLASSVSIARGATALLAAIATLWAGALVAGRFLLWDSARGARLFEQSNSNPMQDVADHFHWLIKRVKRPVVFFIDDLDRCDGTYVVELLETVQILIRDGDKQSSGSNRTKAAASFIIAADGAWIRQSFEIAYKDFTPSVAEPGRPLGYLFLDKLFQLRVPVPAIDAARQQDYLAKLLRMRPDGQHASLAAAEERAVREKVQESSNEAAVIETLRTASPQIRSRVAAFAVDKLTESALTASTEHRLQRFAPLLASNPRSIKRFVNDYSILRAVRTLEGNPVDMGPLALWAIIETRWPALADFLRSQPDAIRFLDSAEAVPEAVPADLKSLFTDPGVHELAKFKHGGPLTPDLIRECCGSSSQQSSS